jgi:hypothetical protein
MPGSISVPRSGSLENKENIGSRMGHANKKNLKKRNRQKHFGKNYKRFG